METLKKTKFFLKILLLLTLLTLLMIAKAHGIAWAATYRINGDLAGSVSSYAIKPGDTLYSVARAFDLGIVEVMAANPGIDPRRPAPKSVLILPTRHVLPPAPREGIVINLPELRLFYYPAPDMVMTFPIGIGKQGWQTPTGSTEVLRMRKDPVWTPPDSIRLETPNLPASVPPGPDNPLGTRALDLGWRGYLIHGTNSPNGVGRRSSHGCIRLYPEDIEALFSQVKPGTKVTIVDEPYKLGREDGMLLLEVVPDQSQADEIVRHGYIKSIVPLPDAVTAIHETEKEGMQIYWDTVDDAVAERSGLPMTIGFMGHSTNN